VWHRQSFRPSALRPMRSRPVSQHTGASWFLQEIGVRTSARSWPASGYFRWATRAWVQLPNIPTRLAGRHFLDRLRRTATPRETRSPPLTNYSQLRNQTQTTSYKALYPDGRRREAYVVGKAPRSRRIRILEFPSLSHAIAEIAERMATSA